MKVQSFAITTAADGSATVNGEVALPGAKIYSVEVVIGTLTNAAADITLSDESGIGGVSKTLLTLTNITANATYYPRALVHDATGTALTGTAGGDRTKYLVTGKLRVTVAQGGNVTSGSVHVWYEKE